MYLSDSKPAAGFGLGLLFLLQSHTAGAAEAPPDPTGAGHAERVVVTATRTPQPLAQVLSDVRVIDSDTIRAAGPASLPELLQRHGGVEISATGGPGQISSVFLRGTNANHVVLLVDGVRINSSTTGTNAFEHLPLDAIDHIEILRGPASSLYGADAIGGVIQVFTRSGNRTNAQVGVGSDNTRTASAGLGRQFGPDGATKLQLQAGWRASDAFSATNASHPFSYNPDTDPYRNAHADMSLQHTWAQGHTVGFSTLYTEADTHYDSGPDSDDINHQRLSTLALESRDRWTAAWSSVLRLARGQDDNRADGSFPSRFKTTQDQLGWQNDITAGRGRVVAGVEVRDEHVDSSNDYTHTSRTTKSLYGGYALPAVPHGVQASLRYDRDEQFGGRTTGNLAYGYEPNPQWRWTLGCGTAYKAPSFNDLYYPDDGFFHGNPDLKPEQARSAETALRYRGDGWQSSVTLFESRIRDLIAVDASFTTVVNVNEARIRGLTWDGEWNSGIWSLRLDATWQDPEDNATGLQLVRRARQHGSVSLVAAPGPWRLAAELVGSGARYDSVSNDPASRMGGYGLVNLSARVEVAPRWRLSGRIDNAADKQYTLVRGYNTAGTSVYLALDYSAQ